MKKNFGILSHGFGVTYGAALFDRDIKTIGKHINTALKEELSGEVVVAKFATATVCCKTKTL